MSTTKGAISDERGYWLHQWWSRRHPVTVYHGEELVAEYEGRFKMLRAYLYIALHPRRKAVERVVRR